MKPWMKYSVLGLMVYLVFLLIQFPANQAYAVAKNYLDEQNVPVTLYEPNGTIWQGKATRLVYQGRSYNDVKWRLLPLDLLTGKLSLSLSFRNTDSFADAVVSRKIFGGLELANTRASMTAQEVLALAAIPAVQLGGRFDLNVASLALDQNRVSHLVGRLVWSDAESKFPQKLLMGDLFADMNTTDDGTIQVKLGDGGGPLELNGDLLVTPEGQYDFTSAMSAREGRQSALGRSLGFIARYDNQNKAIFTRSGNLSEFDFLIKGASGN